jgi:hypothetical protein
MGQEVNQVSYFEPKGLYAISATKKTSFKLPEDDHHKDWTNEGMVESSLILILIWPASTFLPQINQGYLQLLHPQNWTVIDRQVV